MSRLKTKPKRREPRADVKEVPLPELRDIALELINEPALPAREKMDEGAMADLMASIKELGLLSPIHVMTVGKRFEVVAGHRRLLAHRWLHKESIRCFVYPEGVELGPAVMLHENIVREQLNPAEEAIFIAQLVEKHKYTEDDLVRVLKRTPGYIGDRMAILRGDPQIFEYVRAGRIGFSVARILNRFDDVNARRDYLEHAARNQATARMVQDWLDLYLRVEGAVKSPGGKVAEPAEGEHPPEDTMTCFMCGGGRDKYNLRMVWIHFWELDQLRRGLEEHARALAVADAEQKLNGGVKSDG